MFLLSGRFLLANVAAWLRTLGGIGGSFGHAWTISIRFFATRFLPGLQVAVLLGHVLIVLGPVMLEGHCCNIITGKVIRPMSKFEIVRAESHTVGVHGILRSIVGSRNCLSCGSSLPILVSVVNMKATDFVSELKFRMMTFWRRKLLLQPGRFLI